MGPKCMCMGYRDPLRPQGEKSVSDRCEAERGVDRTPTRVQYTTRISTKSDFTHHTQQISKAAVMYDARAILKRVTVLKQTTRHGCLSEGGNGGARRGMER